MFRSISTPSYERGATGRGRIGMTMDRAATGFQIRAVAVATEIAIRAAESSGNIRQGTVASGRRTRRDRPRLERRGVANRTHAYPILDPAAEKQTIADFRSPACGIERMGIGRRQRLRAERFGSPTFGLHCLARRRGLGRSQTGPVRQAERTRADGVELTRGHGHPPVRSLEERCAAKARGRQTRGRGRRRREPSRRRT